MEMALMQRPALSQLVVAEASSRSSGQKSGGCGNSGFFMFWTSVGSKGLSPTSSLRNWRRRTISCRSSGGTRRDDSKIVARTQKRRPRHMKGVTPTNSELLDELQAEEEADEKLDQFEASGWSAYDENVDLDEFIDEIEEDTVAKDDSELNKDESNRRDSSSGIEEVVDAGENTYVVKFFPDGKGGNGRKGGRKTAQDRASDVTNNAQDATEDVTGTVQESAESAGKRLSEAGDDIGETASDVLDIAQDTAADVTDTVQEAAKSTAKSLSEAGEDVQAIGGNTAEVVTDSVQEAAESTRESLSAAGDDVREALEEGSEAAGEVADIVQDTAQDILRTTDETARKVGKDVQEAGGAVLESLGEVTSQGQKVLEEGESNLREQMEESRREMQVNASDLYKEADRTGDRLVKAGEKVSDEAGKSLQNVSETLSTLADDSVKAAGTLGSEALRLGEVIFTAAGEVAGFQGTKEQSTATSGNVFVEERPKTAAKKIDDGPKQETQKGRTRSNKSGEPKENTEEEKNEYQGLMVTVAGASGRTGRLVVEELTRKGVPVRAVVRDKNNAEAQGLRKLFNVEVVQADLYKYESIKKALGDSNVVISTIGARSFAFDPIGTYQGEFEGVRNLVAAAKNKGYVKRFVFITSLGVTFLQIIPLLFWKKQSELYLQRSGLDYTIIRPGGLTNAKRSSRDGLIMKAADTQIGGSISRQKVAEVCVAALVTPEASEKIVEIVSGGEAGRSYSDLFGSI